MTPLERACRQAGRLPKTRRRHRDRQVAEAFRRQQHVSREDLRAVIAYLLGELDRGPRQGRPVDVQARLERDVLAANVRSIWRAAGVSIREAIEIDLELDGIADPDGKIAKRILKRVSRKAVLKR
jgi:hypothetical protein